MSLERTYTTLPESLFKFVNPTAVRSPEVFLWNESLAKELHIADLFPESERSHLLSGNKILPETKPFAQAYAGHQFGNFTMLGDGRAIHLGEFLSKNNQRWDIQLKGSGRTPFSRGGDGRATISSMLREYLISEAMNALGIPSTRSLSVVKTGEAVRREEIQDGGILTRIAKSHIRIGTFEYTYHFLGLEELSLLTQYTIERHYPDLLGEENQPLKLLERVMNGQIDLIVDWMRVGFIHGVMNTDNSSIACETIDYGPCAFMNAYDPRTVFSSIDTNGRYAYGNQPGIIHWNLACFANTLLPLIDKDENTSIQKARELLDEFPKRFEEKYWNMLGEKFGFTNITLEEKPFVENFLRWMRDTKADYTNSFLVLESDMEIDSNTLPNIYLSPEFQNLRIEWKSLLKKRELSPNEAKIIMLQKNPFVIPRNQKVESVLSEASHGNLNPFLDFLMELQSPYKRKDTIPFSDAPTLSEEETYQTFCGT
ncbi:MAG: YdiU family protein [Leptospira sp.]|nr:YdiU family protein [Leptospira sp.]